jgi:phage-related protein
MSTQITHLPDYATVINDGYGTTVKHDVRRTQFEDGYIRQSARASRARVERQVKIVFCDLETYQQFLCWWRDDLRNGSRFFLWTPPDIGEEIRCRFIQDLQVEHKARFISRDTKMIVSTTIEHWM